MVRVEIFRSKWFTSRGGPLRSVCPCRSISKNSRFQSYFAKKWLEFRSNCKRSLDYLGIFFFFNWKMSFHFLLIIPLVSNRLILQNGKHPRWTTCTFKHHHSSPAKIHLTVLRDEQLRHCSGIENISCSKKHCSTNA